MTFKMYKNKSEADDLNKSLEFIADLSGQFKDDTDLIQPELILSTDFRITNENYFIINGYHYFVRNVTFSAGRQYVKLDMDDIETFKSIILNQYAILDRSSAKDTYNTYFVDPDLPLLNSSEITVTAFHGSFSGESFILATTGGGTA